MLPDADTTDQGARDELLALGRCYKLARQRWLELQKEAPTAAGAAAGGNQDSAGGAGSYVKNTAPPPPVSSAGGQP